MNDTNETVISGLLHHLSQKKGNNYFPFSIKHENLWSDGTTRKDFLSARAFDNDIQDKLRTLPENAPIRVKGVLRSSKGSGELFLDVQEVENLGEEFELVNQVKLSGYVHVIKAQAEGETGTGKYVRFAVRQETSKGKDFLVVRVYDEGLREIFAGKNADEPVEVEGTLRSSRGSGVNYVRCTKLS